MKKITLFIFLLTISFGYAQDFPITFEDANDSNIIASVSDGGTFNIIPDVDNAGEFVGQFDGVVIDSPPTQGFYDHIFVPLTTSLDLAATNTISFRVKQIGASGSTSHLFKIQPGTGGTGANTEQAFSTTPDVWETVVLTFGSSGTYNELIIFFDFNNQSEGSYLIDDIEASFVAPPSQEITVKVDISEQTAGGVNIAWWNGAGFDEYPATDEGGGVWSYVLTGDAPANLVTGQLRTYKWVLYNGSQNYENMQSLPGGGGLEHDMYQGLPANEPINTDFVNYLDRGVMPDGSTWTANTYYFNSFRQPGVGYTDIIVTAPTGQQIIMDYSVNGFSEFHGPGTTENPSGTYTAKVRSSEAYNYLWFNNSTAAQEDLSTCPSDPKLDETGATNYRIHLAGEADVDAFEVCPLTLSTIDFNQAEFNVYPNPTNNNWNVSSNKNITKITVYDVLGKQVLFSTPNSQNIVINASSLNPGLYFTRMEGVNGSKTMKLIKE